MTTHPTKAIVFYSGGLMSWVAAKRTVEKYGKENVTLLFTDTKMEDEDLYRFLYESSSEIGSELVCLADGRNPWQVFNDVGYIGNLFRDPCSKILKRDLALRWLQENVIDPSNVSLVFGIAVMEQHRFYQEVVKKDGSIAFRGVKPRYNELGFPHVEAPCCERPWVNQQMIRDMLAEAGIRQPRLYDDDFPHNNCGGFCIKAGVFNFDKLLEKYPERYAFHEEQERLFNLEREEKQTILAPQIYVDGKRQPRMKMTLEEYRLMKEAGMTFKDWAGNGCGCFTDDPEEEND